MSETLQEYFDSRDVKVRVDLQRGVIRGVKILGLESRNGRKYAPEALQKAAKLYEGAKVNVNHPSGHASSPRKYQDRIGVIRNVAVRPGEGLFGDFHFNPKHSLAEQLIWDADHASENVGFSHNVQARTSKHNGHVLVEEILKVQSVDLVADPATTRGLFESADHHSSPESNADRPNVAQGKPQSDKDTDNADQINDLMAHLTLEQLKAQRADLVEAICKQATEQATEQANELCTLREQFDRLTATDAADKRRRQAIELLAEFKLPDPSSGDPAAKAIVSDYFMELLLAAPTENQMRALVKERAQLVSEIHNTRGLSFGAHRRPLCKDQSLVDGMGNHATSANDAKSYANAIT